MKDRKLLRQCLKELKKIAEADDGERWWNFCRFCGARWQFEGRHKKSCIVRKLSLALGESERMPGNPLDFYLYQEEVVCSWYETQRSLRISDLEAPRGEMAQIAWEESLYWDENESFEP